MKFSTPVTLGAAAVAAIAVAALIVAPGLMTPDRGSAPIAPAAVASAPAAAARPALCMSDDELRAYLRYGTLAPIRFGSNTCGERFPDLKEEARSHLDALDAKHRDLLTSLEAQSRVAFTRSFGAEDAKRRDARITTDSQPTFQRIRVYSRDECQSHMAGIEGFGQMSQPDFDSALAIIARQVWDDQRAAVPVCG